MKTLYLDCGMGAAGDMLTAALLELLPEPDKFIEELNTIGIPNVKISRETIKKCGICGTHISVKIHNHEEEPAVTDRSPVFTDRSPDFTDRSPVFTDRSPDFDHHGHTHAHNHLTDIKHIIEHLNIPKAVAKDVLAIYELIATAESKAHGIPISDIHFHEVGTMDAIADITAVCLLMNQISPDEVVVSPVHVGSGHVHCAHGILPVPAPATAYILQGAPIYGGKIKSELCTPTGAALLKHFATRFDDMPVMNVAAIGYGMGKKDFEMVNCVRAILGETNDNRDEMYELSCNVDDMTAERIGYALEQFFKEGAVEAFTVPIGMKKSRPGILICVICSKEKKEALTRSIFKHTTTCGIRETLVERSVLNRKIVEVSTKYGTIRRKDYFGRGVSRSKYEYEDLARIASENNLSIEALIEELPGL